MLFGKRIRIIISFLFMHNIAFSEKHCTFGTYHVEYKNEQKKSLDQIKMLQYEYLHKRIFH